MCWCSFHLLDDEGMILTIIALGTATWKKCRTKSPFISFSKCFHWLFLILGFPLLYFTCSSLTYLNLLTIYASVFHSIDRSSERLIWLKREKIHKTITVFTHAFSPQKEPVLKELLYITSHCTKKKKKSHLVLPLLHLPSCFSHFFFAESFQKK